MRYTLPAIFSVLFLGLGLSFNSLAGLISVSLTETQVTDGQNLQFNFNGLAISDGADGFIRIESGPNSDFDLSIQDDELFQFRVDGNYAGEYTCSTSGSASTMPSCNDDQNDNTFSEVFSFSSLFTNFGIDVVSIISTGSLLVEVDLDAAVNIGAGASGFPGKDLVVTLEYNTISVPSPATLFVLGLGLAGIGWSRRKKA